MTTEPLTMLGVDTQALLRLVKHNEEAELFDLSCWVHRNDQGCGTYGCLVGNDLIRQNILPTTLRNTEFNLSGIMRGFTHDVHYRCPTQLFRFLFSTENSPSWLRSWIKKREARNLSVSDSIRRAAKCGPGCMCNLHVMDDYCNVIRRNKYDKDAAIARVRKAIYYILRKRELLYDEKGEFSQEKYEAARRTGDARISDKVLAEV